MGWADSYVERLKQGETVSFRPTGKSMEPLIASGELVTVVPTGTLHDGSFKTGDIVLCLVNGKQYLHLIKAERTILDKTKGWAYFNKPQYLIGNNKGSINGWIDNTEIFGKKIDIVKVSKNTVDGHVLRNVYLDPILDEELRNICIDLKISKSMLICKMIKLGLKYKKELYDA